MVFGQRRTRIFILVSDFHRRCVFKERSSLCSYSCNPLGVNILARSCIKVQTRLLPPFTSLTLAFSFISVHLGCVTVSVLSVSIFDE